MVSASANVTDLVMVDVLFHVPEFVLDPAAVPESIAVADVQPAATDAASVARSASTADLIAIVSPAET
jgi:hypothetical protein